NVASSNIINWVLFLITVFVLRQQFDLKNKIFVDEIIFGVLSVVIPLTMFAVHIGTDYFTAAGLLGFFILYKVLDKRLNQMGRPAPLPKGAEGGTWWVGLLFLLAGYLVLCWYPVDF
ncbi:MAG TPA: hypothetical protein VIR63_01370, partial [Pontiella sp.]